MRREDTPPKEGPRLSVIRLKAGHGEVCFWIVGRAVRGFQSHWTGNLTVPCFRDDEGTYCESCDKELPTRWRGYLDVIMERNRDRGFLEMTAVGVESLELCVNGQCNLRGSRIKAARGGGDKTRMRFTYLAPSNPEQLRLCPEEIDPHDTVLALLCSRLHSVRGSKQVGQPNFNGRFKMPEGGQE